MLCAKHSMDEGRDRTKVKGHKISRQAKREEARPSRLPPNAKFIRAPLKSGPWVGNAQ